MYMLLFCTVSNAKLLLVLRIYNNLLKLTGLSLPMFRFDVSSGT